MIKLGEKQKLTVVKKVDFGVYLAESEEKAEEEKVLLPKKQVPADVTIGAELDVFIYRDSDDRMIATTKSPKITLGQVAMLHVKEVGKIGAFMDWGLEKDVLLPFREQTRKVKSGEDVLCALYIDKSDRLAVTMNVYEYLRTDSSYVKDDKARGTVYEMSKNFGAFVAVDDIYSGLIPKKELTSNVQIGDDVTVRITGIREDGKLDLSLRDKAYLQLDTDGEAILKYMEKHNGHIGFTDKADPEIIKSEMQMSKNQFKRAIGHLMKNGQVKITADSIERIDR
ncbi:MAG: S1 RNA-binding domain-containing protein [Butyrivibrio sp.]|nr:S1 RNA-binding domain-containing protein [Butyrivibrio sp.]